MAYLENALASGCKSIASLSIALHTLQGLEIYVASRRVHVYEYLYLVTISSYT